MLTALTLQLPDAKSARAPGISNHDALASLHRRFQAFQCLSLFHEHESGQSHSLKCHYGHYKAPMESRQPLCLGVMQEPFPPSRCTLSTSDKSLRRRPDRELSCFLFSESLCRCSAGAFRLYLCHACSRAVQEPLASPVMHGTTGCKSNLAAAQTNMAARRRDKTTAHFCSACHRYHRSSCTA